MKQLSKEAMQEVKIWMHTNARELELARWRYHFENGTKEQVIEALLCYQNPDGGFGNKLEPDNWNPDSSPYTTCYAINVLREVGFTDGQHEIYQRIFKFLTETTYQSEQGWYFNIPTNDHHPRAPWWTYSEEANTYEGIGLTADLSGSILRYGSEGTKIYQLAKGYVENLLIQLKDQEKFGDMGIGGYCKLLEDLKAGELGDQFDCAFLEDKLITLVEASIERDTSLWPYYNVKPSLYIEGPDSTFYAGNEEIVALELEYIIDTRPEGEVWPISWNWFHHLEQYSREFAISENWWRAEKAIEKMRFLKNFNRLK